MTCSSGVSEGNHVRGRENERKRDEARGLCARVIDEGQSVSEQTSTKVPVKDQWTGGWVHRALLYLRSKYGLTAPVSVLRTEIWLVFN